MLKIILLELQFVKIYHSIEAFQKIKNAVVTTGTFDGVHMGHMKIIKRLRKIANDIDGETVLLTFRLTQELSCSLTIHSNCCQRKMKKLHS